MIINDHGLEQEGHLHIARGHLLSIAFQQTAEGLVAAHVAVLVEPLIGLLSHGQSAVSWWQTNSPVPNHVGERPAQLTGGVGRQGKTMTTSTP